MARGNLIFHDGQPNGRGWRVIIYPVILLLSMLAEPAVWAGAWDQAKLNWLSPQLVHSIVAQQPALIRVEQPDWLSPRQVHSTVGQQPALEGSETADAPALLKWLSPELVHSLVEPQSPLEREPALLRRARLPIVVIHGSGGESRDRNGPLPKVVYAEQDDRKAESGMDIEAAKMLDAYSPVTKAAEDDPAAEIDAYIAEFAGKHGVPLPLARAVVQVESSGNPDALGRAGEVGLMQIKPATAEWLGFEGEREELFEPRVNLEYGMRYLGRAYELAEGDLCQTILRYNAGHNARRMNPVSRRYCEKVKGLLGFNGELKLASR